MIVYRIVRKDRISLTGEGAARFPGRWNPATVPCLYTSASPSLAQLEVMVNADEWQIFLSVPHLILHIEIPSRLIKEIPASALPVGWDDAVHPHETQQFDGTFLTDPGVLAFSVPSVISPLERNIIINPGANSFSKVRLKKKTPFIVDPRLIRLK